MNVKSEKAGPENCVCFFERVIVRQLFTSLLKVCISLIRGQLQSGIGVLYSHLHDWDDIARSSRGGSKHDPIRVYIGGST